MSQRILVAEDEPGVAYALQSLLEGEGWQVEVAGDGRAAWEQFTAHPADAVVTDLTMPRMDGLALLKAVHEAAPATPVILVTARGNERVAVDAIRAGAWDYFRKPFENAEVVASVRRALEVARLRRENATLRGADPLRLIFDPQVSPAMAKFAEALGKVAPRDTTVLLLGETGTGKEVAAKLLHAKSPRAAQPFVAVNCGGFNESLIEAELFGWEKGSFTGAVGARAGLFEQAHGGTLFLDEIGEMPLNLQAKLLRVLQEREVQRLGAVKPRQVDVRLVAATHAELETRVREGRFREDLFYRLNVVTLRLPPLRERAADIPLLARYFLGRLAERDGVPYELTADALAALGQESWPGNVRELAHRIERAVALSGAPVLQTDDVSAQTLVAAPGNLTEQVESFEKQKIHEALVQAAGNQSAAARALGIARVTLIDKMRKYGLRAG
jgi:DNA-binding NtrC family response regulator